MLYVVANYGMHEIVYKSNENTHELMKTITMDTIFEEIIL
jgi:hypothetical protein